MVCVHAEARGAVTCGTQGQACPRCQRCLVAAVPARGTGKAERLGVVVGKQGRQLRAGVLDRPAGRRLEPCGHAAVPFSSLSPGELPVGDVADQYVPERVTGLSGRRGARSLVQELLGFQTPEAALQPLRVVPADRGKRACRGGLAEHGRVPNH